MGEDEHGVSGLVECFGIESPGLTSSLALADIVAAKLRLPAEPAEARAHVAHERERAQGQ